MTLPQTKPTAVASIRVDDRGFVWSGSTKLPMRYIRERGALEFVDKDRRTAATRGTRFVEVSISDLVTLLGGK